MDIVKEWFGFRCPWRLQNSTSEARRNEELSFFSILKVRESYTRNSRFWNLQSCALKIMYSTYLGTIWRATELHCALGELSSVVLLHAAVDKPLEFFWIVVLLGKRGAARSSFFFLSSLFPRFSSFFPFFKPFFLLFLSFSFPFQFLLFFFYKTLDGDRAPPQEWHPCFSGV